MKCQVSSNTTHTVMISREVEVPSYKHVCRGEKKKVNLGFNNDPGFITVENNKLIAYPEQNPDKNGKFKKAQISQDWEVLSKFFHIYNIEPNWLNCHFTWGWYDETTGGWTGCMGKVR